MTPANVVFHEYSIKKHSLTNSKKVYYFESNNTNLSYKIYESYFNNMKSNGMTDLDIAHFYEEYFAPRQAVNSYSTDLCIYDNDRLNQIRADNNNLVEIGTPPSHLNSKSAFFTDFKHCGPRAVSFLDHQFNKEDFIAETSYIIIPPYNETMPHKYIEKTSELMSEFSEFFIENKIEIFLFIPAWKDLQDLVYSLLSYKTVTLFSSKSRFADIEKSKDYLLYLVSQVQPVSQT